MSNLKKDGISFKLAACSYILRNLLAQIKDVEEDRISSIDEKLSRIKIIKEEITKVGEEIDRLKKEATLLGTYSIN